MKCVWAVGVLSVSRSQFSHYPFLTPQPLLLFWSSRTSALLRLQSVLRCSALPCAHLLHFIWFKSPSLFSSLSFEWRCVGVVKAGETAAVALRADAPGCWIRTLRCLGGLVLIRLQTGTMTPAHSLYEKIWTPSTPPPQTPIQATLPPPAQAQGSRPHITDLRHAEMKSYLHELHQHTWRASEGSKTLSASVLFLFSDNGGKKIVLFSFNFLFFKN